MDTIKSIQLFFQEGASDKVYNAAIVLEDGLYTVKVEWGRRGAPLNTGAKAVKVSLALAERAFDRVVREKTGKGYEVRTETVAPAPVAPPVGQGSGSKVGGRGRPRLEQQAQLLNTVLEDALDAIFRDRRLVAQQKLDGVRVLVHLGETALATNRRGQLMGLDERLLQPLTQVAPPGTVLDGEVVSGEDGPSYWLFDLLALGGEDLRAFPYRYRHQRLRELELAAPLRLVQSATTEKQKRALFRQLQGERAEGIVFKRDDAPYTPGRPASGGPQLKYKFVKTADVFITANAGNAYQMAVKDGARVRLVGKVFAGTTNETRRQLDELLAAGETPVAEVRYLYATDEDKLYQPVFVGLRDDKEPADCAISQLVRTNRNAADEETAPARPARTRALSARPARGGKKPV